VFQSAVSTQVSPSPEIIVSPPRVRENPTQEQMREARLSLVNPYADWGTLVCDDNKQRMWPDKGYAGDAFCIARRALFDAVPSYVLSVCKRQFRDFSYQAHIKSSDRTLNRSNGDFGLLFRSTSNRSTYYKYYLSNYAGRYNEYFSCFLDVTLNNKKSVTREYNKLYSREYSREYHGDIDSLFAIVAQGGILDLYLNLEHIARIDDFNISSGQIGVFTQGFHIAVTHTKAWAKEGASIDEENSTQRSR